MRINAAVQPSVSSSTSARRTAGSGFSVSNDNAAKETVAAQAAGGISGIDALLALQGVEDAAERRRRFARRGAKALDMLDALKIEIIEGRIDVATLTRLEAMLNELTERSGEARLDGVLDAIGVRVAVELAKRQPRAIAQ
ncbi:MAG TPA: flagellar assembly protein FliX [Xanthobacteraceae bacterium]|nr:flagellar assembly protein FliX [Xanthobacteraceae bacterium]